MEEPAGVEESLVPPGNPLRPRALLWLGLGAGAPLVLLASDAHWVLSLPLGLLALGVSVFGALADQFGGKTHRVRRLMAGDARSAVHSDGFKERMALGLYGPVRIQHAQLTERIREGHLLWQFNSRSGINPP